MDLPRSCGCLVHPTSLPSPYGIGDLGDGAERFLDFLQRSGQRLWQVLPLVPTGYGNSPYASYSAFAGNPLLISPDALLQKELVSRRELEEAAHGNPSKTDYEQASALKMPLFKRACERFYERNEVQEKRLFDAFCKEHAHWLDDYALFMACLGEYGLKAWNRWPEPLARREKEAMSQAREKLDLSVRWHRWAQFEFFEQWMRLRRKAGERGVSIIGDIPIFVDHNSADVWAYREYFEVDSTGERLLVAGVPPDYFSKTGQLWGNPLYRWDVLKQNRYDWWVRRFEHMFHMYDAIRVDHFRGFEACWQIDAAAKTAESGEWVPGSGAALFESVEEQLGKLPVIAEDLGVITPEVEQLRDRFGFPGMKVLHFAFDQPSNGFLPHNYVTDNCLVYTGTHDNDTTAGWYEKAPEAERHYLREYLRTDGTHVSMDLVRLAVLSSARWAIFPLQDLMQLDSTHRMNTPGTVGGNWEWRFTDEMLSKIDPEGLRHLFSLGNRLND